MTKKYLLLFVAIYSFEFTSAQTLSSAPTLTFTNNTGISSDNIATDGDGGSINISDIDIQVYNISNTSGAFIAPLSWENNAFYGIAYNALTANVATGTKGMAIKSVSGAEFKLHQFVYLNWGESFSTTNTVKGYKNTVEVASTTFEGYNAAFSPTTISLSAAFNDVDEVRFYISAGGYQGSQVYTNHSINSIQVSTPVLGINNFELNTKIKIYPNPTVNNVTIDLQDIENASVEVSDMNGRVLFTQKLNDNSNHIKIDNLSAGTYLFKVNSNQGIQTSKVMKY